MSAVLTGAEIYLPLAGLINIEEEIKRLEKELAKWNGEVKRVQGKLANERFVLEPLLVFLNNLFLLLVLQQPRFQVHSPRSVHWLIYLMSVTCNLGRAHFLSDNLITKFINWWISSALIHLSSGNFAIPHQSIKKSSADFQSVLEPLLVFLNNLFLLLVLQQPRFQVHSPRSVAHFLSDNLITKFINWWISSALIHLSSGNFAILEACKKRDSKPGREPNFLRL
jgi:hypothetical protein